MAPENEGSAFEGPKTNGFGFHGRISILWPILMLLLFVVSLLGIWWKGTAGGIPATNRDEIRVIKAELDERIARFDNIESKLSKIEGKFRAVETKADQRSQDVADIKAEQHEWIETQRRVQKIAPEP